MRRLRGFFSASQDIVFDAFRVEDFQPQDQGAASGCFVFGYRIGMLVAGAGALYLATILSWENVYTLLAFSGVIGIITILAVKEPEHHAVKENKNFFQSAVAAPIKDFISRPGWIWIVLFIMLYKLCETTLGTMTAPFYIETGFHTIRLPPSLNCTALPPLYRADCWAALWSCDSASCAAC